MAKFHQFYHAYDKDNRHYTYWQDDGSRITLTAGEDGVTEDWIAQLKAWHREERSVMRHGENKVISLDAMADLLSDHSAALANHKDPERLLCAALEQAERKAQLRTAFACLTDGQRRLIVRVVLKGERVVAIASEQGVHESAIRHQLRRALRALGKKLSCA